MFFQHLESRDVKDKIEKYVVERDMTYSDLIHCVLGAVRGTVIYRFVDENGLKYKFPEKNLIDR